MSDPAVCETCGGFLEGYKHSEPECIEEFTREAKRTRALLERTLMYLTNVNTLPPEMLKAHAQNIAVAVEVEWVWDDAAAPAWGLV